jgi:hypothetical protein
MNSFLKQALAIAVGSLLAVILSPLATKFKIS